MGAHALDKTGNTYSVADFPANCLVDGTDKCFTLAITKMNNFMQL